LKPAGVNQTDARLNIALVTSEFVSESNFDGGLANYTYKLAKWLTNKGYNVTVFLTSGKREHLSFDGINVVKIKLDEYVPRIHHYLSRLRLAFLLPEKMRHRVQFRLNSLAVKRELKKQNVSKKIDIVHYPHLSGYAFYRVKNVPSIVRLSSSTALCHQMGGYNSSDNYMLEQEKFEVAAMKKSDAVFGPSKMIAAMTEPVIEKKIVVIETPYVNPTGSPDQHIFEERLKGKKYVLFFGSIGLIKGVVTISEMIHSLLQEHPDLYYVFIGKKLNNSVNGLTVWENLILKAGEHKDRVIYLPPLKHESLFPVIQNALLVTLPSRTDNFPNACIESMANKKIVIGTKGNGFDQLIDDGESGFVIEVDDNDALLKRINFVLNLPTIEREKIEKKAFERSLTLHPDTLFNSLLEFYKKIIKDFKK
jgi:glycogen synthase